jgi:hypothetical protein
MTTSAAKREKGPLAMERVHTEKIPFDDRELRVVYVPMPAGRVSSLRIGFGNYSSR